MLVREIALRLESMHIWQQAQIFSLPEHPGTTYVLLASCLKRQRTGVSPSCHSLPESKGGQVAPANIQVLYGLHLVVTCPIPAGTGATEPHFCAPHNPVLTGPLHPAVQGAPSNSFPTVLWIHLASLWSLFSLPHQFQMWLLFISARYLLGFRAQSVFEWLHERKCAREAPWERADSWPSCLWYVNI